MPTIYIYGLKCPIAETIRYVGKSEDPIKRRLAHITSARTSVYQHHTSRWIRKLLAAGLEPELVILHTVQPLERWQDIERQFIANAELNGWKLTNSTAGGEGLDYIDPAARALYCANKSRIMKAAFNTAERRAENRERVLKAWANPEMAARRIHSIRTAFEDPAVKSRMKEVGYEIGSRPEVIKAKSEQARKSWADPERSAKRRAALSSDEVRTKMSDSAKARWSDPTKSANLLERFADPESRKKRSISAQERATPEYRAMMAERTRKSWLKRRLKGK